MRFENLKYVLMICIALAVFLKVSNVFSYLSFSRANIEHVLLNDDATDKEEKKVEAEYFAQEFLALENTSSCTESSKKALFPTHLGNVWYFSEVPTPPPAL